MIVNKGLNVAHQRARFGNNNMMDKIQKAAENGASREELITLAEQGERKAVAKALGKSEESLIQADIDQFFQELQKDSRIPAALKNFLRIK